MNRWPSREEVERTRSRYKKGLRIELVRMDDTGVGVRPACWIDLDILYPQ